MIIYMTNWLARPNNPARQTLRNIVVTFADICVKNCIIELAREKGYLLHKSDQVQVYIDLTLEALQKKRELREIIAALKKAKVRHRWATPIKLQVFYEILFHPQ